MIPPGTERTPGGKFPLACLGASLAFLIVVGGLGALAYTLLLPHLSRQRVPFRERPAPSHAATPAETGSTTSRPAAGMAAVAGPLPGFTLALPQGYRAVGKPTCKAVLALRACGVFYTPHGEPIQQAARNNTLTFDLTAATLPATVPSSLRSLVPQLMAKAMAASQVKVQSRVEHYGLRVPGATVETMGVVANSGKPVGTLVFAFKGAHLLEISLLSSRPASSYLPLLRAVCQSVHFPTSTG